jgi:hypothetical protein
MVYLHLTIQPLNMVFHLIQGDKGYPLITSIMIHFNEKKQHTILELLSNRKHKWSHSILENVFGILKKGFREFFSRTKLHVSFVSNTFTTCCLLHNLLWSHTETTIEMLMQAITIEM